MEVEKGAEIKSNSGMRGMGQKKDSHVVKAIDYKLEEIRELKELLEKSEKLQEFYTSIFKMEGMNKEVQMLGNHRYKTAKWFSPKSDEIKDLEKLEALLVQFKTDYTDIAVNISKALERYNSNNKKALDLFKIKNEQLINKIEMLNSK
ncbi:MAG: hypothetical protein ACPK7O_10325 [Methanobacterium sp.]